MPVDGDQKLEIGGLFFADGIEPKIYLFFCEAGYLLVFHFQLFVHLLDVVVKFLVGLYFLVLMVNFFQFYLVVPPFAAEKSAISFDNSFLNIFLNIFMHLNNRKMFEIRAAFNHNRISYFLVDYQMVVSAQNEVDSFDLFCQFDIVEFHHVGQGYDEVALLFSAEFMDHFLGEGDEGMVVTYCFVVGVEGIDPLFLGQAEHAYFQPIAVENVALQSLAQPSSSPLVIDIAEQPGEVGLLDQF